MKILVNATTCVVGGAIQVAVAFIQQATHNPKGHTFLFVVSTEVHSNLSPSLKKDNAILLCTPSPAKPVKGYQSRRILRNLEKTFSPDIVFTVLGPSYVKFKNRHICGFADPWVTHPSNEAINALSLLRKIRFLLITKYKRSYLSHHDFYWVEAEVAQLGLTKQLKIPQENVRIIPNTYSNLYDNATIDTNNELPLSSCSKINIFTLAFPYPHKNIPIIPDVASILKDTCPNHTFNFMVTLPGTGSEVAKFWKRADRLNVKSFIQNIGPLKVEECPKWYNKTHLVFMPTLLETFSATYPEAMRMGKPIVTTDFDFSRNVCGDAALYYSPLSAEDAAKNIRMIVENQSLLQNLIQKGYEKLKCLPSPQNKYDTMISWLETVYKRQ